MKWLKLLLRIYINSSIHVALSVYALMRITEIMFNLPPNKLLNGFVFFGSIIAYNFVKYVTLIIFKFKNITKSLKIIYILSFGSFLMTIFYGCQLQFKTLMLILPFGLLTLFYVLPTVSGFAKNLRNIPTVKIIIIAFVWSGITVLLPLFEADVLIDKKVVLLFIQRFLFVIVLTLPFDIRDFRQDKRHLQTIPQLLGVERTKKVGFFLLLITLLIEFFITPNILFKTVFLIVFFVLLVFLQRASIKQRKYYASFWIEGIPIFWWLLLKVF